MKKTAKKKILTRKKTKPIDIDNVLSMLIFDYVIDVYERKGDKFIGTFSKNYIMLDPKLYIYRPALRK